MITLKEKALLVKFSRCSYSARKYDKKVSGEVEAKYNARDAGRYNKVLIAKEALEKGQKAANEARTYVYTQTLPWSDEGWRILTSANYLPFVQEMGKKIRAIEETDREFIDRYPDFKEEAKTRLNGLYNELDYPPVDEIARKFSCSLEFQPIPESPDFRLPDDMTQEQIDGIGKDLDERVKAATTAAIKDLWQRLYDVTSHAAERLSSPDAIFRDSLIQNITDLCELLPRLNLTNDPNLETMRVEVLQKLTAYSPEQLRPDKKDNPGTRAAKETNRKRTAEEARKILKDFEGYFTPSK
jgi:hypothetical protein